MSNNIWLVFQREYLTRVRKKSFLIVTLITPFAFLLFFLVAGIIFSYQSDDQSKILVKDDFDILSENLENRRFVVEKTNVDLELIRGQLESGEYMGALILPDPSLSHQEYNYTFISDDPLDLESSRQLNRSISSELRRMRLDQLDLDEEIISSLSVKTNLVQQPLTEGNNSINSYTGIVAAAIGGLMGYIMFFVIILFGAQVMRSVTEEKTNRIVEVIISSVKPFHLMLGKILGSSAVSLTQICIWLILIPSMSLIAQNLFGMDVNDLQSLPNSEMPEGMEQLPLILDQLSEVNWFFIIPSFLFYFLTGFLIYAAMFASVGAALGDDINEGQTLTIPIVIPIVLSVYIMFQVVREPHSTLAIWSSMFPFFSSVVMPARLPYGPDWWQVVLSMLLTALTAIAMVWLAGRIYRTGILMYGKKASFKELIKWVFSSN